MQVIKLVEYPNRETRLTWYAAHPPKSERELYEECDRAKSPGVTRSDSELVQDFAHPPLDISSELETLLSQDAPKLKPGFGAMPRATKFGAFARRTLLRAGGAIEKEGFEPSDVIFLTGTLPGSTESSMLAMCKWSSFIVHRLKAWLNKRVSGKLDFYVWELQARGALHLHYAVVCTDSDAKKYIINNFKREWCRILDSVGTHENIDMYERSEGGSWKGRMNVIQAYAQPVKKSVAAYLSKYCSKRAERDSGKAIVQTYHPCRWWGVSRPLLALLRKHTNEMAFYVLSRGKAQSQYEDMGRYMSTLSDKCYSYADKAGFCKVTVSYNFSWSIQTLWTQIMESQTQPESKQESGLKPSEWIASHFTRLQRLLNASPESLSLNYSNYAGRSLESFIQSRQVNIAEAMEITSGLRYLLWCKFRDRNKPSWYGKEISLLERMEMRLRTVRIQEDLPWESPLTSLDNPRRESSHPHQAPEGKGG